jgi:predicted branched-subunit amino acid permease
MNGEAQTNSLDRLSLNEKIIYSGNVDFVAKTLIKKKAQPTNIIIVDLEKTCRQYNAQQ